MLARIRVSLIAVTAAMLLAACGGTVPADRPDDSRPEFKIEFYDLPGLESPATFSTPLIQERAQIDHQYSVVAKLSDPESGIRFFEMTEGKPFAECWVPGSTTQRSKLMTPRVPGGSSLNGERSPSSTPNQWPTERLVSLKVDTFVDESCAAGEEVRWEIVLVYAGVNGAGLPPRDVTVTPSTGYWDFRTTLKIKYP
jgi:hypothetical protein